MSPRDVVFGLVVLWLAGVSVGLAAAAFVLAVIA